MEDELQSVPIVENNNSKTQSNGNAVSTEKSALEVINEIFNPKLPVFDESIPYNIPDAVKAGDVSALQDLDEKKILELKEVYIYLII